MVDRGDPGVWCWGWLARVENLIFIQIWHDSIYEVPRVAKFVETENGMEGTRGWREGE